MEDPTDLPGVEDHGGDPGDVAYQWVTSDDEDDIIEMEEVSSDLDLNTTTGMINPALGTESGETSLFDGEWEEDYLK